MASISPAERLRRELESTLDGVGEEVDPVEAVGRVGARLILQQALEDEVTEYLGRARYERTAASTAHRNGYEPVTVKTTSGSMQLERPRLRNVSQLDFASRVVGKGVARTHALEALVVASFLRGLSARRRGRPEGGLRRARRLEVDGLAHLPGDRRALPRLVLSPTRAARPRLPLPRRDLPQATPRR